MDSEAPERPETLGHSLGAMLHRYELSPEAIRRTE